MKRLRFLVLALLAALAAACAPRVEPAGPRVAPPRLEAGGIVMGDGVTLPLRRWGPDGAPRAVVLALHGINDYSNAFDGAGRFLAGRGIATYAFDQRGFGAAPNRGMWPGTASLVGDARDAARAIGAAHPGAPLYLMGESMGGAVAMLAVAGPDPVPAAGAVLVAPAVWGRESMNVFYKATLWLAAHTVPWWKLTGEGLKIRPSDNVEMLRALSQDPLVIKGTRVDAIWGVVDLMDRAYDDAPRAARPVLLLYGKNDEIIPKAPTFAAMRALPPDNGSRLAFYGDGFHMLLRDLKGEVVLEDVAAWIADRAAPLPSGADAAAREALSAAEGE